MPVLQENLQLIVFYSTEIKYLRNIQRYNQNILKMNSILVLLLIFIVFFIVFIGLIFLIAFLASQSRKKKQEAVLATLPEEAKLKATVRYNKGSQQSKFLKLKAFQGSGVIYVLDDKIHFQDTLNQNPYTFDLKTATISWVGINAANGALNWFKVSDQQTEYYFNVESGMFIWHTSSGKMTTEQICNNLKSLQMEAV